MQDIDTLADPTNPSRSIHLSRDLQAKGDLDSAERAIRWALDFNPEHSALLARLGDIAARRGDLDAAQAWTKLAVDAAPSNIYFRTQLVDLHISRGDLAAAEAAAQDALQVLVEHPTLLRQMSDIAARRGDVAEAFEWADQGVAANPSDPYTHNQQARLHLQQNNLPAAEAATRRALALAPTNASLLRQMSDIAARRGDVAEAFEWADQGVAANPSDPYTHNQQARLHLQQNNLPAAEAATRRALALAPTNASLLRQMSDIAARRGDVAEAFEWADQGVAANPSDPYTHNQQARLHLQQNNLPAAEAATRRALALAPTNASLLRQMSDIAARRGDVAEAFEWADQGVAANPSDPYTHNQQARLHLQQNNLPAAEAATRRALALAPTNASLLRQMSDIAARRGDVAEAFEWADQGVAANPSDPYTHNQQARLHLQQNNLPAAEAATRRALALAPTNASLLRQMSDIAARRGDVAEAFEWADQGVAANPSDPYTHNQQARLHLQQNNLPAAEAATRRALALAPTNASLLRQMSYIESQPAIRPPLSGKLSSASR